ncbi:hypothetical protein TELCIR_08129 [Teladorsagia circumcincta]|uniref:Uncharacterized protein n=1 Tax=Teladorsagia circumcincta TaxID=45464 RepID=A0A2G9UIE3_TELCI|nr:hypothetical protein TELCIR_08129 [Teladorsagia circumcincta]
MATGEHPGHHFLVSNVIYDTRVAKNPLYLGDERSLKDGFYLAEPIWSIYKKATKRKAATFAWDIYSQIIEWYINPATQKKSDLRR